VTLWPRMPQVRGSGTRQQLRAALGRAQGRLGSESRLVALSAGLILAAFLLLGLAAPLALALPGWAGALVAGLPLVVLGLGIAGAVLALLRLMRAGAAGEGALEAPLAEASLAEGLPRPIGVEALAVARSELIDAGLLPVSAGAVEAMLAGRVAGLVVVAWQDKAGSHAVIRLAQPMPHTVLIAPGGAPWPGPLPAGAALTPVPLPDGIRALAWSSDRAFAAARLATLAPVLSMAAGGSALPFLALATNRLCLSWPGGTLGSASLIASDLAAALAAGAQPASDPI
jgi:hypothetical protein